MQRRHPIQSQTSSRQRPSPLRPDLFRAPRARRVKMKRCRRRPSYRQKTQPSAAAPWMPGTSPGKEGKCGFIFDEAPCSTRPQAKSSEAQREAPRPAPIARRSGQERPLAGEANPTCTNAVACYVDFSSRPWRPLTAHCGRPMTPLGCNLEGHDERRRQKFIFLGARCYGSIYTDVRLYAFDQGRSLSQMDCLRWTGIAGGQFGLATCQDVSPQIPK